MKLLLFSFLAPAVLAQAPFDVLSTVDSQIPSSETVDYVCSFQNSWSGANHPVQYPESAHWSPPVLAAHSSEYTMWEDGGMATDGVEDVAETGSTGTLRGELNDSPAVGDTETGSVTFNRSAQMQTFGSIEMTPTTSFLSSITMVAPSPDWFSGFYNVDAINEDTGTWYRKFVIDTYPWDGGTENGSGYSGNNPATSPTEPIKRFTVDNVPSNGVFLNSDRSTVLPVATWTCALEQPDPVIVITTCFSKRATVEVQGKGTISMDQLQIGDHVQIDEANFEPVYSFGHKSKTVLASYLQIYGDDMQHPLEISENHMLFVATQRNKNKAVPASMVKVGDLLVMASGRLSPVVKVSTVVRAGAFAPFTMSGTIVVNGVVSSSYVSLQAGSDNVMIGSYKSPLGHHFAAHLMTTPLRIVARFGLFGDEETYTEDGRSTWIAGPHNVAVLFCGQSPALFGAALALAVTLMAPLLLVEWLWLQSSTMCLVVAAVVAWSNRNNFAKKTKLQSL